MAINEHFYLSDCAVMYLRHKGKLLHCYVDKGVMKRLVLVGRTWYARWSPTASTYYAQGRPFGKAGGTIQLHRWILGITHTDPNKVVGDHRDFNGLNNRIKNLRIATRQQNQLHCRPRATNTSGYLGITWEKRRQKWQAGFNYTVGTLRHYRFVGYFDDPKEAARARQQAVATFFKETVQAVV